LRRLASVITGTPIHVGRCGQDGRTWWPIQLADPAADIHAVC
jgi:hypothetical protein